MLKLDLDFSAINVVLGITVIIFCVLPIAFCCWLKKNKRKKKAKFRKPRNKSKVAKTEQEDIYEITSDAACLLESTKNSDSGEKCTSLVGKVLQCVALRESQRETSKVNNIQIENMRKKDKNKNKKDTYSNSNTKDSPDTTKTEKKSVFQKFLCHKPRNHQIDDSTTYHWITDDEDGSEKRVRRSSSATTTSSKKSSFSSESVGSSFEDLGKYSRPKASKGRVQEKQTANVGAFQQSDPKGPVTRSRANQNKGVSRDRELRDPTESSSKKNDFEDIITAEPYSRHSPGNWKAVVEAKTSTKHHDPNQVKTDPDSKTEKRELYNDLNGSNVNGQKRRPALEEAEMLQKTKVETEKATGRGSNGGVKRRPEKEYYVPPSARGNAALNKKIVEELKEASMDLPEVPSKSEHFKVEKLGSRETSLLVQNIDDKKLKMQDFPKNEKGKIDSQDSARKIENRLEYKSASVCECRDFEAETTGNANFLLNERTTILDASTQRENRVLSERSIDDRSPFSPKFESITTEFKNLGDYENLLVNEKPIFYQKSLSEGAQNTDQWSFRSEKISVSKSDSRCFSEAVRQEFLQNSPNYENVKDRTFKGDDSSDREKPLRNAQDEGVCSVSISSKRRDADKLVLATEKEIKRGADKFYGSKRNFKHTSVSDPILIDDYAAQEWKGNTVKADKIRRGYNAIKAETGYEYIRRIRGDNYCAIRAVLFKTLSAGIDILARFHDVGDITELPFLLLADHYDWINQWSFANRIDLLNHSVTDTLADCLAKLKNAVKRSCSCSGDVEGYKIALDLMNGDPEHEVKLFEAMKFLMLYSSIKLYNSMHSEDDVKMLPMLLFARDTSQNPQSFMRNHLNHVGDSAGFDQLEMMLLGHTLKIIVKVMRLHHVDEPDFIAEFSDDPPDEVDESIFIVAEDDRHYNVLSEDI